MSDPDIKEGWAPDSWRRPGVLCLQQPNYANDDLPMGDPGCCDAFGGTEDTEWYRGEYRCTRPKGHDGIRVLSDGRRVLEHHSSMGQTALFTTALDAERGQR